jgi:hypothetical protein
VTGEYSKPRAVEQRENEIDSNVTASDGCSGEKVNLVAMEFKLLPLRLKTILQSGMVWA